jgi:hypothetical protein
MHYYTSPLSSTADDLVQYPLHQTGAPFLHAAGTPRDACLSTRGLLRSTGRSRFPATRHHARTHCMAYSHIPVASRPLLLALGWRGAARGPRHPTRDQLVNITCTIPKTDAQQPPVLLDKTARCWQRLCAKLCRAPTQHAGIGQIGPCSCHAQQGGQEHVLGWHCLGQKPASVLHHRCATRGCRHSSPLIPGGKALPTATDPSGG